jgi:hypothetical protein
MHKNGCHVVIFELNLISQNRIQQFGTKYNKKDFFKYFDHRPVNVYLRFKIAG